MRITCTERPEAKGIVSIIKTVRHFQNKGHPLACLPYGADPCLWKKWEKESSACRCASFMPQVSRARHCQIRAAVDFWIWKSFRKTSCFHLNITNENESCLLRDLLPILLAKLCILSTSERMFSSQSSSIHLKMQNELRFWPFLLSSSLAWNISGRMV